MKIKQTEFDHNVSKIVKTIPKGKVMTYGQVAQKAGNKKACRAVGNILHKASWDIPCHRVVRKNGFLAKNFGKGGIKQQAIRLKKEGIKIKNNRIIGLKKYLWWSAIGDLPS